jgi:predicted hydrocarbon binding protein
MKAPEQTEDKADALIFLKHGRTIVVDSPVRIEMLRMVMTGEQRFDDIVRRIGRAKSTVSVHLRDMIEDGILAERTDENDARRKFLYLDARYLGTIAAPVCSMPAGWEDQPVLGDSVRPASVFRLIFNTIRTSLLQSGVNIEPVLFSAGIRAGNEVAEIVSDSSNREFLKNLSEFFRSNELGKITIEEGDQLVITVTDCYECQDLPKIGRPACSFDCGLLTAVFTRQTGDEVDVTETHCYAAGDPFCRFVITKKEEVLREN